MNEDTVKILSLQAAAKRLRVRVTTLRDGRFRRRAGLPLTKVAGRVVGIAEVDLIAALRAGRERLESPNGAPAA